MATQMVDTGQATIADLLAVAVQLEQAAQRFYEGLAQMFSHCPEVAQFWRRFAADEVIHEKRLIEFRRAMNAGRSSDPADARMLEAGRKLLAVTVEQHLIDVADLEDAYQTAHDLETSETNTIFQFFIAEFSRDRRIVAAMMRHLDEHVERLMSGLPTPYATRAERMTLKAIRF